MVSAHDIALSELVKIRFWLTTKFDFSYITGHLLAKRHKIIKVFQTHVHKFFFLSVSTLSELYQRMLAPL